MSIIELLINDASSVIRSRYRLLGYLFIFLILLGFVFEISLSSLLPGVLYMDIFNIILSVTVGILFFLNRIPVSAVVKYLIIGLLANMIVSHFLNPVDSPEFTETFLRNAITMGMLVPIYGLFTGKRYIFQIGAVYIFLYVSSLVRVDDPFLVENAPFLLVNGVVYFVAMNYILLLIERMREQQSGLNENLLQQKEELVKTNSDLEKKNRLIREQSEELRELNITKDKLFSVIAHDLRSPFNSILGFSDLLLEDLQKNDTSESETHVSIINSTAKQTLALLENLLAWTQIQLGEMVFKPLELNLPAIILDTISFMHSSYTIKNISVNYSPAVDARVMADLNMLQTILRNLIQNAIKFTGRDGQIDITVEETADYAEITIGDNGIGMNEEVRRVCVGRRQGFTTTGTANEKGSGLGLILCREFVKAHGGTLRIESKPGMGSRFSFTIPLAIS
ncbi:MAG: HAMP domain-containing sensor histidine kinase [Bacteroidales bacterium]